MKMRVVMIESGGRGGGGAAPYKAGVPSVKIRFANHP